MAMAMAMAMAMELTRRLPEKVGQRAEIGESFSNRRATQAMSAVLIEAQRYVDVRGRFTESYSKKRLQALGVVADFVQDNQSFSAAVGTVRGLHFHPPHALAKLVRCLRGRIFDVAIDLRRKSPTFGQWCGVELSAELGNQLFIPAGYGHGFMTLEPDCEIAYMVDAYYARESDGGILWCDPDIGIQWSLKDLPPVLSDKDARLPLLKDIQFDFPYDGNPLLPFKGPL
jgi:dTDP-4-dehydrorhamnose 3,5-epimerase